MQLHSKHSECPVWALKPEILWSITLAKGDDPFELAETLTFRAGENKPRCVRDVNGVRLIYDAVGHQNQTWDIDIVLEVKQVGGEYHFLAFLDNRTSGWTIHEFKFPILFDIRRAASDHRQLAVLTPTCLGKRYATPAEFGDRQTFTYPSGLHATMQWCGFENGQAGLYLGCHDQLKQRKKFAIANQGTHYNFALTQEPYCTPGAKWQAPPVVAMPFAGSWHVAARRYRQWVDTWLCWAPSQEWIAAKNSGWFLCILKQQNGDLMFRYDELDRVADIADEWGLDVLGLFGWAQGGHDRSYPNYLPDPAMGGPEVLQAAIQRVQKRGKKVILYANGQLIDMATDFFRVLGPACMIHRADGTPSVQKYNKFKSTPSPTFVQACMGSEPWYQRLLELGLQAQSLGADGILYDQLGVMGSNPCFCASHGHTTPSAAWAECRFQLVQRLTNALRARDTDFIVMTEGVLDGELANFPYFHGYGLGTFPFQPAAARQPFPELFRYTFPELVITQRNRNPVATRNITNFACFYGMRHEIESRYVADVALLKDQQIPTVSAYSDCNSPPDVDLIRTTPLGPAAQYMRDVIALERRFKAFFWQGQFIDTVGIQWQGTECAAKGFRAADGRLGVVVWNFSTAPQTATLEVPGHHFEKAFEPGISEPVDSGTAIPPETIRFSIWAPEALYPTPMQ